MKLKFLQKLLDKTLFGYMQAFLVYDRRPMECWCIFGVIDNIVFKVFSNNTFIKAKMLNDICVVDWLSKNSRFEFIYNLFSFSYSTSFFVKFLVGENVNLFSSVEVYKSACWLESEIWDMFGIFFFKNPDLRSILTDYGFEGYPLRKDFPLTGYLEMRYDDERGCLVYEPVELAQEYSTFSFLTPWEDLIF